MTLVRPFFARPAPVVAPELLGCRITHGEVTLRLTEVEAYTGEGLDPGSHAFRGRTPRTEVMFGEAGHLYVYFSYGMHWCANVVCGDEGEAQAVLLRAGAVVAGHDVAAARRDGVKERDWARGPARLTSTLGIDRAHDGADVCGPASAVTFSPPEHPVDPASVRTGPRVGVSGPGGDGTAYPYRYWLDGEPTVSAYRPAVARRRRP
ncbi:DNA-3-methyladenine glycosylase [Knoellia sp. CPCC 206435]|uniref:DNA-3-methyladenine glycosylase n=1 Tax=Knoellia terrae TaxID=3404797 RepID=UPI003B433A90